MSNKSSQTAFNAEEGVSDRVFHPCNTRTHPKPQIPGGPFSHHINRATDAVEKITAKHLNISKKTREIAKIEQQEVRWHVAQILPRLEVNKDEQEVMVNILYGDLNDKSKRVKTLVMQTLADQTENYPSLGPRINPLLYELTDTGSPAMRSRGKKLLEKLWPKQVKA